LPRRFPDRNQTLGILEPFDVYSRQTLIQLGVPENAIETLDNHDQFGEWKYVRLLRTWLEQHPEATAVVFCDRFHSRETRYAIRHVLTANQRHRVQVYALPSRSYDEQRWWRSRRGAVDYFNALIGLMYASCVGEDPDQPLTWNVDDFEWRLGHP
jgi:hypothetical protein